MNEITKNLRQAADCAPLWKTIFEAAANEIERLQSANVEHENKIKADAVRRAAEEILGHPPLNDEYDYFIDYANKLERGDI